MISLDTCKDCVTIISAQKGFEPKRAQWEAWYLILEPVRDDLEPFMVKATAQACREIKHPDVNEVLEIAEAMRVRHVAKMEKHAALNAPKKAALPPPSPEGLRTRKEKFQAMFAKLKEKFSMETMPTYSAEEEAEHEEKVRKQIEQAKVVETGITSP